MILPDVNVLVYAFREDSPDHKQYSAWLDAVVRDNAAFALSELVLSGFVRVVTHPRVFVDPTPIGEALSFADALRAQPHAVLVQPGPRHWEIFSTIVSASSAKGNLIPDAYLAALAIESGCEWISTDGDFARFPGLRWRHPMKT